MMILGCVTRGGQAVTGARGSALAALTPTRTRLSTCRRGSPVTFAFPTPPPIGSEVSIDGHAYRLLGVEPYTRKQDGAASFILTWEGRCQFPECQGTFQVTTGLRESYRLRKGCDDHRGFRPSRKKSKGKK